MPNACAQVVLDNVQQREDQREGGTILGHLEVAVDGMEEPEVASAV